MTAAARSMNRQGVRQALLCRDSFKHAWTAMTPSFWPVHVMCNGQHSLLGAWSIKDMSHWIA